MVKDNWEYHSRDLMEQQPGIRQILNYALRKDSIIPCDGLSNCIQHWYYESTIYWWVISREGYTMDPGHVIPLLYPIHRKKIEVFKDSVKPSGEREGGVFMASFR